MKSKYEYGDKVYIPHLDEEGEVFCYVKFGVYAVDTSQGILMLKEKCFYKRGEE